MVYVEYNTSKKQNIDYAFDVIESDNYEGYTLLPFSPFVNVYPESGLYPSNNVMEENNPRDYLLRFIANRNYNLGNYCFKYNNKYYLFHGKITRGMKLYFKFEEIYDHETEQEMIIPIIEAKGYTQMKEILDVYDVLELNKSGGETTFSSVKADFGIRGMNQLPMAFQEIRIWKGNVINSDDLSQCELLFTGFLDRAMVSQKINDKDECDIEFSLLSPMNLATKRYITLKGTYNTSELFNLIFEPLINDGFEISRVDVDNKNVSVNYYLETIETVMNDLSNKLNIYWTIDSNKNIHIIDIIKLLGQEPKMIIGENDNIKGMYELKPTIENNNYFNCVNVKNARVYSKASNTEILEIMKLIKEETQEFVNPIDFGINGCSRVCANNNTNSCTILSIFDNNGTVLYDITYNKGDTEITLPNGVVWSDSDTENATLVLQRDSFFKNLVTGIQWKGNTRTIENIKTDTSLKYQLFRITNSNEIYKCSEFLTDSGIIENTIDVNESWFTYSELIEYCNNLMTSNSNNTASVEIAFDENYNFEIGDKIRINKPRYFIDGEFVITEIKEQLSHYDNYDCQIIAQNNKLQANYIDIFRKSISEENDAKYDNINIVEFVSDEIIESYGVYTDDIPSSNVNIEEEFVEEGGE